MKTIIKTLNHGDITIPKNEEKQWVAEWCNMSAPETLYFCFKEKKFIGEAWRHGQFSRNLTEEEVQKRIEAYIRFVWGGFGNSVAHLLSNETKVELKKLNPEIKFWGENIGDFYLGTKEELYNKYFTFGKVEIINLEIVE